MRSYNDNDEEDEKEVEEVEKVIQVMKIRFKPKQFSPNSFL